MSRPRILFSTLASLLLMSLIPPVNAYPGTQTDNSLVVHLAMPEPANLDPVQISRFDSVTRDLDENLFVGLTRYNPQTQDIEPMLAKSWSVSDDGLTWTFTLRDDIQWVQTNEDGSIEALRPVAAGDFVYAIQRACDPLRPSPLTANMMVVRGCKTVANAFPEVINDLFIAEEIGVRATGPSTLEIDLLFPSAYFLTLVSTPEFRPLARESVSDTEAWIEPTAIMTNGPFALSTRAASGMTLVRNPYWPDSFAGNVEQIDITFTTDPTSAITNGSVDMARLLPAQAAALRSTSPDLVYSAEGTTLTLLGFSYERNLVNTPEVRRALANALDRNALISQFFPEQDMPQMRFTPPGVVAAPAFVAPAADPAQAQAQFSAAGYPACEGVPENTILLVPDDDPLWTDLGTVITQQWAATLGCNPALFEVQALSRVLLIELSHAAYDPEAVTRSHIWLITWSSDYPDANGWIADALHCHYGYIKTGRECDATDALLDQAAVEMDTAKRADLYSQAEEAFFGPNGTFPVIPLFISTSDWAQQPWLKDVNLYGPARYDLWTIDDSAR